MRTTNHTQLRSIARWAAQAALLLPLALARPAQACVDDTGCKGDRVCDRKVCVTPRALAESARPPPAEPLVAAPAAAAPVPAPAPPPQAPPLVMIEPMPPADPVVTPIVTQSLPTAAPAAKSDSAYEPSLGFRCVFGPTTCSFQIRPLAADWAHADLHADALLGGLEGGDLGLGVGTRHWQLGESSVGMVFRWDDDVVVARASPSGDAIVAVALETGPKLGVSYAVSRDLALEADVNGGLFLGYGFALSGGADQSMIDGFLGLLVGARM